MSPASHYRAQADLARRLAEITVQPNLERELRHVAEELDHLANEIASDDPDFLRSCGGHLLQNGAARYLDLGDRQ